MGDFSENKIYKFKISTVFNVLTESRSIMLLKNTVIKKQIPDRHQIISNVPEIVRNAVPKQDFRTAEQINRFMAAAVRYYLNNERTIKKI